MSMRIENIRNIDIDIDIDIDIEPDVTCKSLAHIEDRTMICMFGVPCFRESWIFSMPKSGLRNFAI
jgi:hypothetical protein